MIAAQRGSVWYGLATLRSVQDGPWGPVDLPILEEARYRILLEGSPIIPVVQNFFAPTAGSHQSFDLQAELGHNIWIHAVDENGNPLPSAEAVVSWTSEGKKDFVRRRARSDGYINPWSMPSGPIVITVSAPGYVPEVSDPMELPLKEEGTFEFVLRRAGRLRGKCLHEGKPVEDFEVVLWPPPTPASKHSRSFRGREDGSFEIADAPQGPLLVTASSDLLVGSEPRPVTVSGDTTAEVLLELVSPRLGIGKVVDNETRQPVSAAEVQLQVMGDVRAITEWGAPLPVEADGTFRVQGFVSGSNEIRVRAPGYSESRATGFGARGLEVDFGEIGLIRPRALELQLTAVGAAAGSIDFTSYMALSEEDPPLLPTFFLSEGIVRFEHVTAGARRVSILPSSTFPATSYSTLFLTLDTAKDWKFSHRVAGPRYLTIEVVARGDTPRDRPQAVYVMYQSSDGTTTHTRVGLPAEGIVRLEGLDTEEATIDVYDGIGTLATAHVAFAGGDELHVVVPIGGKPHTFRVVDEEGEPVAGALLFVQDPQSPAGWLTASTDQAGECSLIGVPSGSILVHVLHNTRGTRHDVTCDGSIDPTEIVIESQGRILLVVLDGDQPLAGISCRLVAGNGKPLGLAKNSDAAGTVTWDGLHPGSFHISFFNEDCWPNTTQVEAQEEGTQTPVQIRRLGNLSVSVHAANGLPVYGQRVQIQSVEFDTDVGDWIAQGRVKAEHGLVSDQRGEIHIQSLPHGHYQWAITTAAGESFRGEVEVPPLSTGMLAIALP